MVFCSGFASVGISMEGGDSVVLLEAEAVSGLAGATGAGVSVAGVAAALELVEASFGGVLAVLEGAVSAGGVDDGGEFGSVGWLVMLASLGCDGAEALSFLRLPRRRLKRPLRGSSGLLEVISLPDSSRGMALGMEDKSMGNSAGEEVGMEGACAAVCEGVAGVVFLGAVWLTAGALLGGELLVAVLVEGELFLVGSGAFVTGLGSAAFFSGVVFGVLPVLRLAR